MIKSFPGFCPVQGKDYAISINYVDNTSLSDTHRVYEKGLATCTYNMYGDKCNANDCPIIKKAPDTI